MIYPKGFAIGCLLVTLAATSSAKPSKDERFECPASYGNFPHSTYCNLYWMCRGGNAYLMECVFDWLFDKKLALCDLPQNVDCGNLITPGTAAPNGTTTTKTTDASTTKSTPSSTSTSTVRTTTDDVTTAKTTPKPFVCGADGLYPNPADCGSYYACTGGTAILQECSPGTWFNPNTNSCDFPGDYCTPPRHGSARDSARRTLIQHAVYPQAIPSRRYPFLRGAEMRRIGH